MVYATHSAVNLQLHAVLPSSCPSFVTLLLLGIRRNRQRWMLLPSRRALIFGGDTSALASVLRLLTNGLYLLSDVPHYSILLNICILSFSGLCILFMCNRALNCIVLVPITDDLVHAELNLTITKA
ncbi:hypothetical protein EXIGLDRAFT_400903 [Exidia glandulosa HHB12029]|uniref:Uncharacterized protein n=1 Tax=Exidia glandulosa HHB12029 TaxID=1314781 RepID=A0A165BLI2_EXIGL|nr:hypothetical protein EXIGLDRAFT_400903 [Exidia glandulosa HHB12029]